MNLINFIQNFRNESTQYLNQGTTWEQEIEQKQV